MTVVHPPGAGVFSRNPRRMSCVLQSAIIAFSDVQREEIQKRMTSNYMTCDTTIYSVAVMHYNSTGKAV
jgi:hypothetical protein